MANRQFPRFMSALFAVCGLVWLSACSGGSASGESTAIAARYLNWMSAEVREAWRQGFFGQGVQVTLVDAFIADAANKPLVGDLGLGSMSQMHGEWTTDQVELIAPQASVEKHNFRDNGPVPLVAGKLNVINLSYSIMGALDVEGPGRLGADWKWSSMREQSVVTYARNNLALVVKAAGNHSVAVDGKDSSGMYDYLNLGLIGAPSAIFVGALDGNGSAAQPTQLSSYSNFAGDDPTVQSQFITVGVLSTSTGLAGTSFAAPIVSGYAAILGSKFTTDSPKAIRDRLLSTARQDTISGYDPELHGVGEASLARALAPNSIQ